MHYPELNDSKNIGMCIYTVAVLCVPAVVINLGVKMSLDMQYGMMSGFLLLGTTITQCIIFLPKVNLFATSIKNSDNYESKVPPNIISFAECILYNIWPV